VNFREEHQNLERLLVCAIFDGVIYRRTRDFQGIKGSVPIQVGTTFCGKTENPKGGGGVKAKNCAKIRGIQVFSCFSFRLLFHHGRTFIFNRVINLWLNFLI